MRSSDTTGAPSHRLWLVGYRAASDAAAKGVMFAITIAAARTLSHDDFGLFALASTLGWLGAVAADFGIQMHLARATAQHPERGSAALARWLPVRIGSSALSLTVLLVLLARFQSTRSSLVPLSLFAVAYGVNGLTDCVYYFFRGLGRTDLESGLTLLQRALLLLCAAGALWWWPGLTALSIAFVLPAVATFLVATALASRQAAASRELGRDGSVTREFLSAVAPIGAGILLSALYFRIDVFLLAHWRGAGEVATYNAVFRVIEALRLLPAAVLAVMLPTLFRATSTKPLLRLAVPLTAIAALGAVGLWYGAAWFVPWVYGQAYADGVVPFRILALALPLMALNYALTSQLIGWHGHRAYAALCAGALAVNLLLNWQLTPLGGMSGAAWSTLWTELFLTGGCAVALVRTPLARGRLVPAAALETR